MATLNAHTYQDLSHAQQQYIEQIDRCAEEEREKLSTSGASQARVYEAKVREAQDGGGPLIEAEAEALGSTVEEVISSVLSAYHDWKHLCGRVEGVRLKAKAAIRSANSPSEMYSITKNLEFN